MKNCPTCGAQNPDNALVCGNCGTRLDQPVYQASQQTWQDPQGSWQQQGTWQQSRQDWQQPAVSTVNVVTNESQLPEKYRPLSAWAYFGYTLLYSIPLVGFILAIVFAFSDANINRRNHARSMFCGLIIFLIIGVIVGILVAVGVFSFSSLSRYYY